MESSITLGLTAAALAALPVASKRRKPALADRLHSYVDTGFHLLEYDLTLPDLPTDATLRAFFERPELEVFWHTGIVDLSSAFRFFARPEWAAFVSNLAEQRLNTAMRHTIAIALDRSIAYTAADLKQLITIWEQIEELIPCVLAFEHSSWKKAEDILTKTKVPRIELDAPKLPGIIKRISGEDRKRSYLKLVGRNAKAWLLHDREERFCHSYTDDELRQVAQRVLELRSHSEEVAVLFANYPSDAALCNARAFRSIMQANMSGGTPDPREHLRS